MKKRNARLGAVVFAFLCLGGVPADGGVSPAEEIDCAKCMFMPGAVPSREICPLVAKWKAREWKTYRETGAFAIAEAEGPQLKESLLDGTDGFWFGDEYVSDKNYRSKTRYSFRKMSYLRNDFGATGKSDFLVGYSYPLDHPDRWTGIYLHPDRRYIILAYDWDQGRNAPVLHMACELPRR